MDPKQDQPSLPQSRRLRFKFLVRMDGVLTRALFTIYLSPPVPAFTKAFCNLFRERARGIFLKECQQLRTQGHVIEPIAFAQKSQSS
jgi:hypothetical protein